MEAVQEWIGRGKGRQKISPWRASPVNRLPLKVMEYFGSAAA